MKNFNKNILVIFFTCFMLIINIITVYATTNEEQIANNTSEKTTEVIYIQDSSFTITIPKLINLDLDKKSYYEVSIIGDISSDKKIIVEPEESFKMNDISSQTNAKKSVEAYVTQDKIEWYYSEFSIIGKGSVDVSEISAGNWEGSFFFNIKIEENLAPGLYDDNNIMLYSWDELVNDYELDVETDYMDSDFNIYADKYWDLPGLRISYNEDMTDYNDDLSLGTKLVIGDDVEKIGAGSFYNATTLTEIVIPDTVKSIGLGAFFYCENLEKITLPKEIDSIGAFAFAECLYLTDINIPKNLTKINDYTFYDCMSLTNIYVPNSVTSIGNSAFENCTDADIITLGNQIETIGDYAFSGCTDLTAITLPDTTISIGEGTFWCCYYLNDIKLSENLETIGNSAFRGCIRLEFLTLPDKIKSIGSYTFKDCVWLEEITLSNSLESIGMYAFYDCDYLYSITIPDTVTSIDKNAFNDCDYLETIYYNGNAEGAPWGATNAEIIKN